MPLRPSYFLRKKCQQTLLSNYRRYNRKKSSLNPSEQKEIYTHLQALQLALQEKNTQEAKKQAMLVENAMNRFLPTSPFEKGRNTVLGIGVALAIAILIRLTWFELYEIPTGSMRPTLKEQDRLIVSKTSFGINIPFSTGHFYFSPDLVERNGIVTFTGEGMDIKDVDTKYFYLFPGKKQYVKRIMGKPGDTLYFYGGLIYGFDKEGHDISALLQPARLDKIEHIPFLQFEGKATAPLYPNSNNVFAPIVLRQMNEPIAKLSLSNLGQGMGKLLSTPLTPASSNPSTSYASLWGIDNFGMARLLTKEQTLQFTSENKETLEDAALYMEIKHHPSLYNIKIRQDGRGRMRPSLETSSSILPLQEKDLQTLFSNLYTVRFIVKNGLAYSYGHPKSVLQSPFLPKLEGVPDGTYEFYYGKAYKILFQGISIELEPTHPLYTFSPERVQLFYNLGMEFNTSFSPQSRHTPYFPLRYVYFRNGSFYALGAPLFSADDTALIKFVQKEKEKAEKSPLPYQPFIDRGPPLLADGSLDTAFIKEYGLNIPNKMYLGLGDNHAISADSREFGFVPESNLRGSPDFIFWPPGSRFGHPNQPPYPFFNLPRSIVWVIGFSSIGIALYFQRKSRKIPPL